MKKKVIITAAISGAEVTQAMNPAVPYTLEDFEREARLAYEAGAAIIHLHARHPDGSPTQDRERYRQIMQVIRKACPDVIIQPSTGGATGMSADERLEPLALLPEMATLDCGTMNFGGDEIFINTENMIIDFARRMMEAQIKPELECFDKSMIDMALRLHHRGQIPGPLHFNLVMGVNGGIAATPRDLLFLRHSLPSEASFTVCAVGRHQQDMTAMAILLGGHVRVGFEDNVMLSRGVLAESNGVFVERIAKLIRSLGREVATPQEARQILQMPPFDPSRERLSAKKEA